MALAAVCMAARKFARSEPTSNAHSGMSRSVAQEQSFYTRTLQRVVCIHAVLGGFRLPTRAASYRPVSHGTATDGPPTVPLPLPFLFRHRTNTGFMAGARQSR